MTQQNKDSDGSKTNSNNGANVFERIHAHIDQHQNHGKHQGRRRKIGRQNEAKGNKNRRPKFDQGRFKCYGGIAGDRQITRHKNHQHDEGQGRGLKGDAYKRHLDPATGIGTCDHGSFG